MPRKTPEFKVTVSYRLRSPEESKRDAERFVAMLTTPQKLALIAKLEKEIAGEKLAAKQQKGGQAE